MTWKARDLWRHHPVLMVGFVLTFGLAVFFALRAGMFMLHWSDPAHQSQQIEGWMPLRYVARSWDVPPEILAVAAGRDPDLRARITISEIAAASGRDVEDVAGDLRRAIDSYRAGAEDD